MPEAISYVESVQYGDTFALLARFIDEARKDAIYVYNPASNGFDQVSEREGTRRSYVTPIQVSEDKFPE